MKKLFLTACAAAIALFALPGQAQTIGEDKAPPAKSATPAEKEAAKSKRKATSKEIVKKDEGRIDSNTTASKGSATAQEKADAKAKRKTEGAAAAKSGSAGGEAKQ